MYQNTASHVPKSIISTIDVIRDLPFLVDMASLDDPVSALANPWISSAGVTSTLRMRSEPSVIRSASPLAAGFKLFDISHNNSSTKTVDSPILTEKTTPASLCLEGCLISVHFKPVVGLGEFLSKTGKASCCRVLPDRRGYILCCATNTATIRVRRKGIEEKKIVDGGTESKRLWRYAGVHSSQSSVGSMLKGHWRSHSIHETL